MNNAVGRFWPPGLAAILLLVAATPTLAAALEPHWLDVRLVDRQTGGAVANAAVCLGTRARADQFGAYRSDSSGGVRFDDVGSNPLVLTVSGKGYRGHRQALEPLYENRVLLIKLATGGGGPDCDAPQRADSSQPGSGLSVESVRIRADSATGPDTVTVAARASAPVNQIRVSEQADFADTEWQPYADTVPLRLSSGPGLKQVYVQVRRVAESEGATLEVLSPVRRATYRLP